MVPSKHTMDTGKHPSSDQAKPALKLQTRIGLLICALGVFALGALVWDGLKNLPSVRGALLGGSMAALATALGTLPVLLAQRPSERMRDTLFGFGAGVMLAACAFSLVIPALAAARSAGVLGGSAWAAGSVVGTAI